MKTENAVFDQWAADGLVWLPERGMGFREPTDAIEYGSEYFEHYAEILPTRMGQKLTAARVDMVASLYGDGPVVDVGIGAGAFVLARPNTRGFDVNPEGVAWLRSRDLWTDPYEQQVDAITLWDVLEHVPDPTALLRQVTRYVFASLPIFRDAEHVVASKHYKPGEHLWYWTRRGFRAFMAEHGFHCVHETDCESRLGREDILSFVFRRRG